MIWDTLTNLFGLDLILQDRAYQLIHQLVDYQRFLAHGSRLMAYDPRFMAQGRDARGAQDPFQAWVPGPSPGRARLCWP